MSETSETPTVRHSTATAPAAAEAVAAYRAPRVFQIAAWVAIVAGIVFILAVIFFTGFILGHRGGHHGHHHKHHAMMHHRGPGGPGNFGGPVREPPPLLRPRRACVPAAWPRASSRRRSCTRPRWDRLRASSS
jgi:hypothetical protein